MIANRVLRMTDSFIDTVAGGSPAVRAVTLQFVKDHVRALGTVDDDLIEVWIEAAVMYFKQQTGRPLLTETHEAWIDAFPFLGASGFDARIELPWPPLQAVESISYLDEAGVLQTLTDGSPAQYLVSAPVGPYAVRGWVEPLANQSWPIAAAATGAVRIRYTCGYGDTAADIPELARGILCLLVGHFDQFRTAVVEGHIVQDIPFGFQMLLQGFKHTALSSQVLPRVGGAAMTVALDVSKFRQLVTLSNPAAAVADGDGGFTQTYAALDPATWRAAIEAATVRASERKFAGTVVAHASYILTGRFHAGITTQTRMVWVDRSGATHTANVLDVDDPEGAGVLTVALVSEVVS